MKNYYKNKDFVPDAVYLKSIKKAKKSEKNLIIFFILLNIMFCPFTIKKALSDIFFMDVNDKDASLTIINENNDKAYEIRKIYNLLQNKEFDEFNIKNGKGTIISEDLNSEKNYLQNSDFKISKIKEKVNEEKKVFEVGIEIDDKKNY